MHDILRLLPARNCNWQRSLPWAMSPVHSGNSRSGSKEVTWKFMAIISVLSRFVFIPTSLFEAWDGIDGALELADFDGKLMTVCNKTLNRWLTIFIGKKCFVWSFNIIWLIFVILFFNLLSDIQIQLRYMPSWIKEIDKWTYYLLTWLT